MTERTRIGRSMALSPETVKARIDDRSGQYYALARYGVMIL
jgi:hypothetical protein